VVVSIWFRSFFLLNSNENKGGYDTGLADLVQGKPAGRMNFSISHIHEKTFER
jgi:hypothetical protein